MPYVREYPPGIFTPLELGDAVTVEMNGEPNIIHPPAVWQSWSKVQQEAIGIYSYEPFVPLPGFRSTGEHRRFHKINDVVREAFDTVRDVIPDTISRSQLFIALWRLDMVTQEEAIAAAQYGTVPEFIRVEFDKLPEPQKTTAYIKFASEQNIKRDSPFVKIVADAKGFSKSQVDDWFIWAKTEL